MASELITLLDTYLPPVSELDPVTLLEVRQACETWLRAKHPDLDTRPNSPFGDLFLTPGADLVAGVLEVLRRFRSDLNLENTASGTTYDCAFVESLLRSLGIIPRTALPDSGIVRLVFCVDQSYTLDAGLRFQFNNETESVFELALNYEGALEILPVGSTVTPGTNQLCLHPLSAARYAVEIPVKGRMVTPVLEGVTAALDRTITDLDSVVAVAAFTVGTPESNLRTLATKARDTFHSASMTTRVGARRFLQQEFPALRSVSVCVPGDEVLLRGSLNPLGVGLGCLDIYAKSSHYLYEQTQYLRLTYDETNDVFAGKLDLINPPLVLDQITYDGNADLTLDRDTIQVFSRSLNPTRVPLLTAAYSTQEELWIVIPMPRHPTTGVQLITPEIIGVTETAVFRITYRTDPMLRVLSDFAGNPDNHPPGLHLHVRGFVPLIFSSLTIHYGRPAGVTMKLDQARSEIGQYIRGLGYPDVYQEGPVLDSMYYAGASWARVEARAQVCYSTATHLLPADADDPVTDYDAATTAALQIPRITITHSAGFKPTYIDAHLGTADETLAAVGARNLAYILRDSDIHFTRDT